MAKRIGTIGRWGALVLALAVPAAFGQVEPWTADLWSARTARSGSLGLQPARTKIAIGCGASLLPCADERAALAARQAPSSLRWNVELSTQAMRPAAQLAALAPARQGLSLSLVGSKPIFGSSVSVYGRVGASYALPDAAGLPLTGSLPGDGGYGLSFGAGLSMDLTPRLSATFGWDREDFRLGGGVQRDPLRSTSLGLQYRY